MPSRTSSVLSSRPLAAWLYVYLFLDDFVLLYPVYALLFTETGLSTAQISSLFVFWSVTGLVVEIPSGVWADAVSRRLLLVLGPVLRAVGYGLWVFTPSYAAFATGFVLWGVSGALRSGALEALVWDALRRTGETLRYATLMGRGHAAGTIAVAVGTALAAPAMAVGGYPAVGLASVLACLAAAVVAATFPEAGRHGASTPDADEPDVGEPNGDDLGFVATLRAGIGEVHGRPHVRAAVLLVPGVTVIWGSLEEYTPLLAAGTGVSDATVPLLLLLISAGTAVGGMLGGRGARLSGAGLAVVLLAAAAATAVGALTRQLAGFVLIGLAFAAFQLTTVAADNRLQHAITGPARSTVTSLAGFITEVATIAFFGLYALGSAMTDHAALFAVSSLGYLVVAATVVRPIRSRDG